MSNIRLVDREDRSENKEKSTKKKRHVLLIVILIAIVAAAVSIFFIGRHEQEQYAKAQKRLTFGATEAAHFDGHPVDISEFMLFSVDIKNGYEKQYGSDIWTQEKKDADGNTDTYENIAKEDILEQIRLVWALNKEGKKRKVALTSEEKKIMDESADDYYNTLKKAGATGSGVITKKQVRHFYTENYYAQKVYYKISGNNAVEASTGSAVKAAAPTVTTEGAQKLWLKVVNKWYPDFQYKYDINWELLDQIKFTENSSSSDGSAESQTDSSSSSDNDNLNSHKSEKAESEEK